MNTLSETSLQHENSVSLTGKYFTFELGDETYGVGILNVQEIIKMQKITKIPRAPDYVEGVVNLRGKVIPVISIRRIFGMEDVETSRNTCIVIMQVKQGDISIIIGAIVDRVSEVLNIGEEEIESAPSFGAQVDNQFILGMAKTKDSVKILLDADKLVDEETMSSFSQTREEREK